MAVLYLVDRLIGFESLSLLVFLCLGVFKSHSQSLMKCQNKIEVQDAFFFNSLTFLNLTNLVIFK